MKSRVAITLLTIPAVTGILVAADLTCDDTTPPTCIQGSAGIRDRTEPRRPTDGDGIPNGIEFVIGGDPSAPDSDSNNLLPTVSIDAGFMYLVFRRADVAAGCDPFVEHDSTLAQWSPAGPALFTRLRVDITP
jgi:hypothetical protein